MSGKRRTLRIDSSAGSRSWPVLLLLLAVVLVPTVCVLWFVNEVTRNEHLAVRNKLTDVYRSQTQRCCHLTLQSLTLTALLSPPLGEVGRGSGREGDAEPGPIVVQRLSPTLSESGERQISFVHLSC